MRKSLAKGKASLFFLLVGAWLLPAPTQAAEECANVDHSDHFGDPRDQGRNGWCFAYTAADLIGEKLGIKGPDMISALDVSASYAAPSENAVKELQNIQGGTGLPVSAEVTNFNNQALKEAKDSHNLPLETREGGYIPSAIALYNLKGGYCLESALPSQSLHYEDTMALPGTKFAYKRSEYDLKSTDYIYSLVKGIERNHGFEYPHSWECDHWEDVSDQSLSSIMAIANLATKSVVKDLDHRCGARGKMPLLVPDYQSAKDSDQAIQKISKLLASGKSVGLDYDVAQIKASAKPGEVFGHSSLLVGSRFKDGTCQFKIRNSWGADCTAYKGVKDCQNGSFWVTADKLKSMMEDITWIK